MPEDSIRNGLLRVWSAPPSSVAMARAAVTSTVPRRYDRFRAPTGLTEALSDAFRGTPPTANPGPKWQCLASRPNRQYHVHVRPLHPQCLKTGADQLFPRLASAVVII
jgi:hypothetical protein